MKTTQCHQLQSLHQHLLLLDVAQVFARANRSQLTARHVSRGPGTISLFLPVGLSLQQLRMRQLPRRIPSTRLLPLHLEGKFRQMMGSMISLLLPLLLLLLPLLEFLRRHKDNQDSFQTLRGEDFLRGLQKLRMQRLSEQYSNLIFKILVTFRCLLPYSCPTIWGA